MYSFGMRGLDQPLPADVAEVMEAAEVLRVREFDLFRLAWRWWHGEPGDDRVIERYFVRYMFHKVVPSWVRQYSRDVLGRVGAGKLVAPDYGIVQRRREPPVVWPGYFYVGLVMAVALLFVLMVIGTAQQTATNDPIACELGEGMSFLARLAYSAAAGTPPDCL